MTLDKYYKKTGFLLPQSIIQNGLFKVSRDRSKDDIILISKAKALVMGKVKEIFNEIGTLRWIASNQHGRDYQKITASEEENNKKNLQLKLELIEYLYECNKFDDLVSLSKEITDDVILLSSTQIALTKLIIKGDKTSAINLMKKIQFNSVASDDLKQFIVFCSDYLTNDQVISTFPTIEFELPILHEDMINREGGDYSLHKDIITLYEDLKIIWIYNPEAIKLLILNVSILPNPSKNIYNSIFYLSELWYKSRISKLTCEDVTDLAKQALRQLYVSHTPQHNKTNTGLFDYDSSLYFINLDIHKVYRNIFNLISRLMTSIQVEDYVNYWFHLEETLKGYSHYTVALTIAKQLKATPEKSTPDLINRLIHYAEKLVRIEENTYDLTSSIGKVAEVYGICGLKEDFKRIYNELIDVSFGVHDRKDYQASNILEPLEMIHNIEPDKTLMRLSQIFHIQNNLSDAGNGRMHHICVSEFIAFTARIYPELAFQLLEKEERSISREEAFDIVFKQLIKLASSENLRLYLSLAKTIPRWEKGDSRDNHFLELCLSLLRRALQLHNESFTREILDIVKYNILVELDKPIELSRFTEEFVHTDMSYLDYSLPEPTTKEKVASKDLISFEYKKFMKKLHPIDIGELTTLFENNYPEFENIIRSQYAICLCNNRNQVIRGEYHRLKEVFQDFVASLPSEANPIPERTLTRTIKNFVTMKDQVVNMNQSSMIKLAELIACLNCFIEATSKLFPKNSFSDFLKDRFDEITWVEHILQRVNENHKFVFSKVLSDENLSYLVENVSILNVVSLVNFVDKWIVGRSKSVCLLKIAHRLLKIDPKYSQELKDKVALDRYDNHIFPRRENGSPLGFEIIDLLRQPDKEFGKSFLLKSYISQYGAYYDDLVFNLDKLMKYHDFFEDGDAINAYFEANLLYNKELSKGLPNKDNEYEFIINHVENLSIAENVIKHHVWLFDYPVVKIRELSLQSVYDLVCFDPELLKILIRYGLESVSDNQVEHSLTVLIAISLRNPEFLLPYKQEILHLSRSKHFNIIELSRMLLFTLGNSDGKFLSSSELSFLKSLNTKSPIICNNQVLYTKKGKNFLFSEFQAKLLLMMHKNEDDESEFQDDLYTDLTDKGLGSYSGEDEGAVHREYNINSNFDNLEIQTPYYDEVKNSLNRIFHSKITRGCFEESFIKRVTPLFRIYDPSKLLFKTQVRPDYVNWLPTDVSESDFIEYKDIQEVVNRFVQRESEYITLAEMGSQRTDDEYGSLSATCYFEVIPFLKIRDFEHPILYSAEKEYSFAMLEKNLFAYELPTNNMRSASYPIAGIKPLLELSYCQYRGEHDLVYATLISDVFSMLGIEEVNLLELFVDMEQSSICASRWQDSYTSGSDRRRYKPNSEGFTLKIKKDVILDYLIKNNMELCYEVSLRRSVTKYRPEDHMEWFPLKRIFVTSLN